MRLLFLKTVCVFIVPACSLYGQSDFPNVIPPSPTATAMQQYGNTNVSLYTGAINVSIPIHTIKLKELEFPIVLKYSGSGGINIQEIASWVGIGWTLNATGAISRTIYGLADDRTNGYLNSPAIPPLTEENLSTYLDFAGGILDAEPDKYFYSANGISGSFYINKQKQVVQVPLTNNKIIPEFDQFGKIIAFDLITDRGITYRFSEHEESRSYVAGVNSMDNNYYVSSWYLVSVRNFNNTETIYFHYEAYSFDQTSELYTTRIIDNPGGVFWPRYSVTKTNAKRVKYITYNQSDTIKFITGSLPRRDLIGEKFLDKIEIKEQDKQTSVDFSYSYFGNNGVEPITSVGNCSGTYAEISLINGATDGDNCKRLKLDNVVFFNADKTESLPYTFEYYTQAYLPHRFSYARDHWGFYNGQDNNPGLEPRRKIDRRPILDALQGSIDFDLQGNANREPSAVHAKAGVLTKIIYPTGGSTLYEYELHQSSLNLLPNQKQSLDAHLSPTLLKDTIHIETINDPFVDVRVNIMGMVLSSEYCGFTVIFKHLNDPNKSKSLDGFYENAGTRTIFLEEGDYEISFLEHDGVGNCFEEFYTLKFLWQNEVPTSNKDVGGLRIKKTIDISGLGDSVTRVYNYTLQNSTLSSGSLVSIPRYGYYESGYQKGYAQDLILSFIRMYNTNTPLALTQGSHVGYKRVEVTTAMPQETGKSVFYYTSPADFPDFTRGWEASKYDDEVNLGNGNSESTYIFPHHDSRDWKRGLLYAQVDYAFQNDEFVRIASKESHYKIYAEVNTGFDQGWISKYPNQFQFIEPEYNNYEFLEYEAVNGEGLPKLLGVRTQPWYTEQGEISLGYVKNYEFFTGRIELVSQAQKVYRGQNIVTSGITYFYQNNQFYYPTKIQTTTSLTDSITTLLKYSFDHASFNNILAANRDALNSLTTLNVVADPVEKITLKAGAEIKRERTNFVANGSAILPDNINFSFDGQPLEQQVDFITHDAFGNLLEYKGKDEISVSFKYGYENKFPVAKAVNAHYTEIYYNSFEETGTTGEAKTGKKYHVGDLTVTLTSANLGSVLSYWYWENDAWHYKQIPYSGGNYLVTDGERIDEVRIYPKGALMTTYTYSPGIGLTSVTDQNNQTTTYEYDSFGRLSLVKDHQGNIIQHTRYHITNSQTY